MDAGKIWVQLGLDIKGFEAGIKKAEKRLVSVGQKMQSIGKTMSLTLTLPILAAGTASFKYASDLDEAMSKTNEVFKGSAKEVQKWSKTTLTNLGVSQGAALDAVSLFGDMATSMGLVPSVASDMSMSLVTLGADLASFKNISMEQTSTALKGIFTGETEALKTLGVVMTQQQLETYALANGYTKLMKDMTQAELVQLRYAYVMNATTNAQGDFLRTSDGAANQMRIFTESLKETSASFGKLLLPIFTPMIQKVNELMNRFANLSDTQKKWIVALSGVAAAIGPVLLVIGKMVEVLPKMVSGFKMVSNVMKAVSKSMMANPYLAVAAAVTAIGVAFIQWYKASNAILPITQRMNKAIADTDVQIKKEQSSMNYLFDTLKKTNLKTEDRKKLINQINNQYGDYLPYLLTEKSSLVEIETAQRNANSELAKNIVFKNKQMALEKELGGVFKRQQEALADMTETLEDNGYTHAQATKMAGTFYDEMRKGQLRWEDIYKKVFGSYSDGLRGMRKDWAISGNNFQSYVYDLNNALHDEKVITADVAASFDTLLNSMGAVSNTTNTTAQETDDLNDLLNNLRNPIDKVAGEYEKLTARIEELKNKIQEVNTISQQGGPIPIDFDLTALMTELDSLEKMKKKIDWFFSGSVEETKNAIVTNLNEMSRARESYGLTEIELLQKQQMEQYALLDKAKEWELALFEGNKEKEAEITKQYAELEYRILEEYSEKYAQLEAEKVKEKKEGLELQIQALQQSVMTEEQIQEEAMKTNIALIKQAVDMNIITFQEGAILIQKLMDQANEAILNNSEQADSWSKDWKQAIEQIGDIMEQMTVDMATQFLEGISQLGKGTKLGIAILGTFLDAMGQIGKIVMAAGIAVLGIGEALQKALATPAAAVAAIAAGAALIALAGVAKASLANVGDTQGLATGGIVTSGGVFKVGEQGPEMVSLPRGSAVTPNHLLNSGGQPYILSTRIAGRDLEIILERTSAQTKRR